MYRKQRIFGQIVAALLSLFLVFHYRSMQCAEQTALGLTRDRDLLTSVSQQTMDRLRTIITQAPDGFETIITHSRSAYHSSLTTLTFFRQLLLNPDQFTTDFPQGVTVKAANTTGLTMSKFKNFKLEKEKDNFIISWTGDDSTFANALLFKGKEKQLIIKNYSTERVTGALILIGDLKVNGILQKENELMIMEYEPKEKEKTQYGAEEWTIFKHIIIPTYIPFLH